MTRPNAAIFGATGEVGQEIINCLAARNFPVEKLHLYAGKSAGTVIDSKFGKIEVQKADRASYLDFDIAFWAISGSWSEQNWPRKDADNCYIIDNSSAFRYHKDIPLVIPEINGNILEESQSRLIANPNCTTAIAAIPLHILNDMAGIEKICFSTYQSASGAGNGGRKELLEQTRNYINGKTVKNEKFAHPLPFNLIPHIDNFMENDYTREEMKTDWESRKILGLDDAVRISSGCVRVPVERSHALDIIVETKQPVDLNEYRCRLSKEKLVKVMDDPQHNVYPMPISTSGQFEIEVGRIRHPQIFDHGIRMFVCGDQLYRGAALNAVLIAEKLYEYGKLM